MTRMQRSRSLRRVTVKTPSGRTKTQYKQRKPSPAICAKCGAVLSGVPRETPIRLAKVAKTSRRPERPYGGVLCSKCSRKTILERVMEAFKK
jgi:large subunit ribosomal protein L34e